MPTIEWPNQLRPDRDKLLSVKQELPELSDQIVPLLQHTMTWTSKSREGSARWYYVMAPAFFQTLSMAIVMPMLPRLKLQFFHGDGKLTTRVQSTSEVIRAVLVMAANQALGSYSDEIGRKPILCIGLVCNALPLLCLTLSSDLWFYFATFALVGALGGQASLFNAYIADCSREEERSRRFSLVGATTGISLAIGALGGGMLEKATGRHAVFATSACMGVLAVAVMLAVPESLPLDVQLKPRPVFSFRSLVRPLREFTDLADSRMWFLTLYQFMRGCVMEGYMTVSLFAITQLVPDWTDQDNGFLFVIMGVSAIIAQGLILPCLTARKFEDRYLALFAQFSAVAGSVVNAGLLAAAAPKQCLFASFAIFNSLSFIDPIFTKLVTTGMPKHVGLILGLFQSLQAFTAVFAPFLFTAAYAVSPICPFIVIAVFNCLALVSLVFAFSVGPRLKAHEERREESTAIA